MSSTDKRLYDYTDEEIWALLESRGRKINKVESNPNPCVNVVESKPWFSYHLTNGVIYFVLKGGNDEESCPANLDLPLKYYQWLSVELWDYREMTPDMVEAGEPSEIKWQMPGFPEYHITLNFQVWPHIIIDPHTDERFKDQEWTKYFVRSSLGSFGCVARVSPTVFAEIVRFCDKISNFKAFW